MPSVRPTLTPSLHRAPAPSALSVLMLVVFCEGIVALNYPVVSTTMCYDVRNCKDNIRSEENAVQICDVPIHSTSCPIPKESTLVLRGGGDAVTDYERERQEKLRKNQAMLASLGLSQGGSTSLGINKRNKKPKPKGLTTPTVAADPTRRSIRNLGKDRVKYTESSQESADSSASVDGSDEDDDEEEEEDDDDYEDEDLVGSRTPIRQEGRRRGRPRVQEDDEETARARSEGFRCPAWAPRNAVCGLYLRLRQLRQTIASKNNIRPHQVAHDRSIWEMAVYTPLSQRELVGCWGFSASKSAVYGGDFISAIRAYNPFWAASMPSYYRLGPQPLPTPYPRPVPGQASSYPDPSRAGLSYGRPGPYPPAASGTRRPPFVVNAAPGTGRGAEDEPARPVPGSIFINGTWHPPPVTPSTLPARNTQRFGAATPAGTTVAPASTTGTTSGRGPIPVRLVPPVLQGHVTQAPLPAAGPGVQPDNVAGPGKEPVVGDPKPPRVPLSSPAGPHVQGPRASANGRMEDGERTQVPGQ